MGLFVGGCFLGLKSPTRRIRFRSTCFFPTHNRGGRGGGGGIFCEKKLRETTNRCWLEIVARCFSIFKSGCPLKIHMLLFSTFKGGLFSVIGRVTFVEVFWKVLKAEML